MPDTKFNCLPTIIGTLPHTDPVEACSLVTRYLKDIPAWPQLPRRSQLENMYAQFSEGFPGVVIEGNRIYVDTSKSLQKPLEELYAAYLQNDVEKFPVSPDYAAGLHAFLAKTGLTPLAVKGQITGPLTWGMTVTYNVGGWSILYDEALGDAVVRLLMLKAAWQEKELKKVSPNTIIFIDEPYMVLYGASSTGIGSSTKSISLLNEFMTSIKGLKGLHCCGNTDWSVPLATNIDILSFDAYNYAEKLSLYPAEVKKLLDRGGAIAWGIVPNDAEAIAGETAASLQDRLEEAMAPFTRKDIRFGQLIEQGLLTHSCGLAPLPTEEAAECALELLAELSDKIRRRYT